VLNVAREKAVRLVLDTNTVVSGLLWDNTPSKLIDAGLEGQVELFTSQPLLLELEDVLLRSKFAQRVAGSGLSVQGLIARYAVLAQSVVQAAILPVSADPDDDHVLACAVAVNAHMIVSGDAHLLNLKHYQGIEILNARRALERIVASVRRD